MVSLDRAAQSIGRRVRNIDGKLRGTVSKVDRHDVWVKTTDGDTVPCIPENLVWVSTLSEPLREALANGMHYESAQVFYDPCLFMSEADEALDYDDEVPNLAVIGSSGPANDGGNNRALIVIAPMIRRAYPVSITVDPHLALEVEELLGWAEP